MSWGGAARAALASAPLRPQLGALAVGSRGGLAGSRALAASRGLLARAPAESRGELAGSRALAASRGLLARAPAASRGELGGSRAPVTSRGLLARAPAVTSRGLTTRAGSDPGDVDSEGGGSTDVTEPQVADAASSHLVRRGTWRRSLSPAARLATLLDPESLSPDAESAGQEAQGQGSRPLNETQPDASVKGADEDTQHSARHTDDESRPNVAHAAKEMEPSSAHAAEEMAALRNGPCVKPHPKEPTMGGEGREGACAVRDDRPLGSAERCLGVGDLVLVENRKGNVVKMQKMLKLKEGKCLHTMWGSLQHNDLVGRWPGVAVKASDGALFVVRRPSLYEFTLFMSRTATIAYPKDVSAMLMHLDLRPGDVVLEAGSGSGAMTLMLSGAVWEPGHVVSCDVRGDHLHVAQKNVASWRSAWAQARGLDSWPRNISFLKADVLRDTHLTQQYTYDAVVLDMLNVHLAVSCVLPALKPGGVIMIYVANITQAVDVAATVRSERLPVSFELVLEVSHRSWVIIPALHRDGSPYTRPTRVGEPDEGDGGFEKPSMQNARPFVCRPNSEQYGHTAFLIKLRKILPE
ncbi:tRNA (adenine(58)-N(1))-methyltransferase, mitochondrial [Lampetra fluviatilis]